MAHESTVEHENDDSLNLWDSQSMEASFDGTINNNNNNELFNVTNSTMNNNIIDRNRQLIEQKLEVNESSGELINNNNNNNNTANNNNNERSGSPSMIDRFDRQRSIGQIVEKVQSQKISHQNSVPHLFAETPKAITHHHDTDDEDTDHSSNSDQNDEYKDKSL